MTNKGKDIQGDCCLLLTAIDFFTQSLHSEQLAQYGYTFIHNNLKLNSSALFLKNDKGYELVFKTKYLDDRYFIEETGDLKKFATLYGRILTKNFEVYFNMEVIEKFNVSIIIPLIVKDELVGFILSDGKNDEGFTEDEMEVADAIMRLMNSSYESSVNFTKMQEKNLELDKKIFNLFFINHTSKTLLSELHLDKIYTLCIDIIRELTSSSVTSFGLFDEIREKIVIRGYKDIIQFKNYYAELELIDKNRNTNKIVYHIEKDREALNKIFVNSEEFKKLDAEYVILIVKDKILGFVTIGKSVSNRKYDSTLFELIESVATSIYISITNALLFDKITKQTEMLNKKYSTLKKLNRVIKNINSCENIKELINLTLRNLELGYGVKKAIITLVEGDKHKVVGNINMPKTFEQNLEISDIAIELISDETHYEYTSENLEKYFPMVKLEDYPDSNCLIVSPIRIDNSLIKNNGILGYIIILSTYEALKQEEILLIDTLANSISPIIYQMEEKDFIKENHKENEEQLLVQDIKEKLIAREEYFIDFKIYYKRIEKLPFVTLDLKDYDNFKYFYFDNFIFIVTNNELEENLFEDYITISDIDDFYSQVKEI